MVFLTRIEHFNAAHKLVNPSWTPEKNEEVFGLCANENWHGHNYELYVTIKGEPDPETGFLFDVKKLSGIIISMLKWIFWQAKCVQPKTWLWESGTC
jgi:6-pyruvoyltetrahydropterin/6-carboxytetrahydropterin synthase